MAVVVNVIGKTDAKELEKAQRALEKLGGTAKGPTASGFSAMRTAAIAAGTAIAVKFGVDSVKAYAEAEASQARLSAAFEKFPALADTNIEALRALNSELQTKTRFDDDQTAAAQAVLAQFKLTGRQIAELTPLLQDYASATGQDVVPAAESLGKAFLGNAKALKAVGINFKASGDTAKDFATITAALRQQVGGLAENEGKTAQGQLAILDNTIGDLKESVGEALVPALNSLVEVATPVVRVFGSLPTPVRSTAIAVGVLGTAALVAGPKIMNFRRELELAGPAGARMSKGIKGAAGAFAAFAIAATAVSQLNSGVNQGTEDMQGLLTQIGRTGQGADKLGFNIQGLTSGQYDFNDSVKRLDASPWDKAWQGIAHLTGQTDHLDLASKAVTDVDNALADMVKGGHANDAALAVAQLRGQFQASGGDVSQFDAALVSYHGAISATIPPTVSLTVETNKLKDAEKGLKNAFEQLDGLLSKRAARRAWKADLDDIGKAIKDAGGHFSAATPKGRAFNDFLDQAVGDLSRAAQSFKDPADQAAFFAEGLGKIRTRFIRAGVKPEDVDRFLKPFKKMKGQAKGYGEDIALGLQEGLNAKADVAIARARALGKAAALAVKDGAEVNSPSRLTIPAGSGIMEGVEVGAVKRAKNTKKVLRDATKDALAGAREALTKFQDRGREVLDFIAGVKGNITSFGSVAGFEASDKATAAADFAKSLGLQGKTGLFAAPDQQGATAAAVIGQQREKVRQAQQFAKDFAALRKLGLNNASLQEILGAGPVAGDQIAQALLKGGKSAIGEVNGLEHQLNAAAASLGDNAALSQYGINGSQAKGLVNSTVRFEKGSVVVNAAGASAKDQKAIEAAVEAAVTKAVRKALREARANR